MSPLDQPKRCGTCGLTKPASEFSVIHKAKRKPRLHSRCKVCGVMESRAWAVKNPEKRKAIWKAHAENNRAAYALGNKRYYVRNRAERAAYQRAYRAGNPEKDDARHAVAYALQVGRITRGPCEECGSVERVQAHHSDYSKPLEIQWLCAYCHGRKHCA